MNKQVKTLNDLRDSHLLYEKNLPSFGYSMLLTVFFLLAAVTVWMVRTPKVYIVKGSGTVESPNKNYIMSSYTGEIKDIYIKEGSYVQEGDVLFTVASTDLDLQSQQATSQIAYYENMIEQLKKLESCIQDNTNYFDEDSTDDKTYYNQYESYVSQREQLTVDTSTYESYGYTDAQIQQEVITNENKINELYYSTLQEIGESIQSIENQKAELEIQNEAVASGQEEYQITAPVSGTVHMPQEYKSGMVVQAASSLGSIASEQDEYVIDSYIDVSDVSRIQVGDSVKMVVSGLLQSDYGVITGTVTAIDSDATVDSENSKSYFKVEVTPDVNYLVNKSGEQVNISNGMAVETRIEYDQVTYFEYLLDGLGVIAK